MNLCKNLSLRRLRFCQNCQNLVLKCKFFFKKIEVGSLEVQKGSKSWVSGAKMWPEKKGGAYYPTHPRVLGLGLGLTLGLELGIRVRIRDYG